MNDSVKTDDKYSHLSKERLIEEIDRLRDDNKKLRSQETIEWRDGKYIQRIIRHGKKRRVKTKRLEKKPEKMTLCWIGNVEIYMYPYQSLEKIFIRINSEVQIIDKFQFPLFMRAHNRLRWVHKNSKDVLSGKKKSECAIAEEFVIAYNEGMKKIMDKVEFQK